MCKHTRSNVPALRQPSPPEPSFKSRAFEDGTLAKRCSGNLRSKHIGSGFGCACGVESQTGDSPSALSFETRFRLGPTDDAYEQEADQAAKRVAGQLAGGIPQTTWPTLRFRQFSTSGSSSPVSADVAAAIERNRDGGRSLPLEILHAMEGAFGADFGDVRIHTDRESDRLNESLQSVAFTSGRSIFFRNGMSATTHPGRELLAHELTHVLQQGDMSASPTGEKRIQRSVKFRESWDHVKATSKAAAAKQGRTFEESDWNKEGIERDVLASDHEKIWPNAHDENDDGCQAYVKAGYHVSDDPKLHVLLELGYTDWEKHGLNETGCNNSWTCHLYKGDNAECWKQEPKHKQKQMQNYYSNKGKFAK